MSGSTHQPLTDAVQYRFRAACTELDSRIRRGDLARAEEYFAEDRELAEDESAALDVIYAEIFAREAVGESISSDEYLARFPQWEAAIQRQFAVHQLVLTGGESQETAELLGTATASARSDPDRDSSLRRSGDIGEYELLEKADQGAAGIVYRARHRRLGHVVALKMLSTAVRSSPAQRRRFENEAALVARLNHPHIVRMYEMGTTPEGEPFLVLEWVSGGSLTRLLNQELPKAAWVARLIKTVARAVHTVHEQGIIHRDLTPANILLDKHDEPRMADFGLAKVMADFAQVTRTGEFHGTPSYTAPEQIDSPDRVDRGADVYALGGILYAFLTGRAPFLGETLMETLNSVVHDEPVPPERLRPQAPRDLSTICLKCLQKNPAHRYASAELLADDLGRFLRGEPIRARRAGWGERTWKWARRNPAVAALLIPAIVAPLALMVASARYVVGLREARATAEEHRALANRSREQVAQQLETSRRTVYAMQLTQANSLWKRDPGRALRLLHDPQRCPPDLREFTWRLFEGLCRRDVARDERPQGSVTHARFMPDGESILSGSVDGGVRLWQWRSDEGESSRVLHEFNHPVRALAVSPDGRWIAAADDQPGSLRVISGQSGATSTRLWGHTQPVSAVAFSPDGERLVSASPDRTCLWDFETGRLTGMIGRAKFDGAQFSPNGDFLALTGRRVPPVLWDVRARKIAREFSITGKGRYPRFSRDGRLLAILQEFGGVEVFRVHDGERIARMRVPQVKTSAAVFSPDASIVLTVGSDKLIREWDVESGQELSATAAHGDDIWAIDLDPPGQFLVTGSGDQSVKVWNRDTYRDNPISVLPDVSKPLSLATSPDGKRLAMGGQDRGVWISRWENPSRWTKLGAHDDTVTHVDFTPDSRTVIASDLTGRVVFRDLSTGRETRCLNHQGQSVAKVPILAFATSPDGGSLATAPQQGTLWLWDLDDDTHIVERIGENTWCLTFSDGGRKLTLGTEQGSIWVLNLTERVSRRVATIPGEHDRFPASGIIDLAYSPNGVLCATCTRGGLVTLWNAYDWHPVHHLRGHSASVQSVTFSRDGKTLVTGSGMIWESAPGEIKFWDLVTGSNLATFPGFSGPLAFSPDHQRLLTAGQNAGLFLFSASGDGETESPLQPLRQESLVAKPDP